MKTILVTLFLSLFFTITDISAYRLMLGVNSSSFYLSESMELKDLPGFEFNIRQKYKINDFNVDVDMYIKNYNNTIDENCSVEMDHLLVKTGLSMNFNRVYVGVSPKVELFKYGFFSFSAGPYLNLLVYQNTDYKKMINEVLIEDSTSEFFSMFDSGYSLNFLMDYGLLYSFSYDFVDDQRAVSFSIGGRF